MEMIAEKSIGIDGQVFADRRGSQRRRALKPATLSFNKGFSTFECVVRNLSAKGALLSMGETFALPTRFLVTLDGQTREAALRWRSPAAVGVEFMAV